MKEITKGILRRTMLWSGEHFYFVTNDVKEAKSYIRSLNLPAQFESAIINRCILDHIKFGKGRSVDRVIIENFSQIEEGLQHILLQTYTPIIGAGGDIVFIG